MTAIIFIWGLAECHENRIRKECWILNSEVWIVV